MMRLMFMLAVLVLAAPSAAWSAPDDIKAHMSAMQKDAEDMVAHGGMGDAKAIVQHCGELTKHAQAILRMLPPADLHSNEATAHLHEAIKYCQKVAKIGADVDPGVSLNPATKARAAVREAVKHLLLIKGNVTLQ